MQAIYQADVFQWFPGLRTCGNKWQFLKKKKSSVVHGGGGIAADYKGRLITGQKKSQDHDEMLY